MNGLIRRIFGVLLGVAALHANAQPCTTTISPPTSLNATVEAAAPGAVICLNPGTYAPPAGSFPNNGSFAIGNAVTVRGLGATPAQVVLNSNNSNHAVYFTNYASNGKVASGSQLINLTIQGSQGGVQIQNFTNLPAGRLTDIKFKDVVITTLTSNPIGFGFLTQSADRIVLDNVTITSNLAALYFIDTTDSLVMNSTVTNTVFAHAAALAVLGGNGNRFINNTFGQPRVTPGSGYSFNGGAVVFYNTSNNRYEGNTLQGMQNDALDYSIVDLAANGVPFAESLNNYAGKNNIIHTAFSLDGLTAGSSGIWSNCGSDGTWLFGNDVRGSAEAGLLVWDGRSNMFLGNLTYNNGLIGTSVSGDAGSMSNCTVNGGVYQRKPTNNYVQGNAHFFNKSDQMVVRDADNTHISRNFFSPTSGLGGPAQACTNPACQAAVTVETDGTAGRNTNTGTKLIANTTLNNQRGLWAESSTSPASNSVTNIAFYLNRVVNATNSRWVTSIAQNIDAGSVVGGNFWTQHSPTGNPSALAYSGVFHDTSNNIGNVVDRFPYQSDNLGRGYGMTLFEPRAGASAARGTKRTVRWDAHGCYWIDLTLGGSPLAASIPNIGYAIVTIPVGATLGSNSIVATCKDATGIVRGTTVGPAFNVTSANLAIVSPGRDDVFNINSSIWVGWTNPTFLASVAIDYSLDTGASWTNLANVAGISATNPVTSTRVTLPATGSSNAMLRVRSGGTVAACGSSCDETDSVYSLRAAAGSFDASNIFAGRTYVMGQPERLEWSSPTNSRLVTITATAGVGVTVATDLPDRGFFDWVVPEFTAGTLSLNITYKTIAGAAIGAPVNLANAGQVRRATTVTFGTVPTVVPGGSAPITITTSSGVGATLSSSTPSVCTVSGNTITGVANGTCTITANATGNATFAAASPSTISFSVGQSQSITFTVPQYLGAGTSMPLTASASSGLGVTFASLTPGVCSVAGATLTGTGVGTCTVTADQPGDATYAAAPQVQRSLQSVAPGNIPRLVNISTRGQVLTGGDVMIAGFIIGGSVSKTVVINVAGPSLVPYGIPNALANPTVQLVRSSDQAVIANNDNWQTQTNPAHVSQIQASGFAPSNGLEPALIATLPPGAYTAIVQGVGGTTGVGLVGVFEVDHPEIPLINISTRMQVLTGGDVMIAGFIIQGTNPQTVVINVAGPSLVPYGIPNALGNPTLQLVRSSDQAILATNDNWQSSVNAAAIQASGFAPAHALEPAIMMTLPPGAYTAIVQGVGGSTGVGLVGVFKSP